MGEEEELGDVLPLMRTSMALFTLSPDVSMGELGDLGSELLLVVVGVVVGEEGSGGEDKFFTGDVVPRFETEDDDDDDVGT